MHNLVGAGDPWGWKHNGNLGSLLIKPRGNLKRSWYSRSFTWNSDIPPWLEAVNWNEQFRGTILKEKIHKMIETLRR